MKNLKITLTIMGLLLIIIALVLMIEGNVLGENTVLSGIAIGIVGIILMVVSRKKK